MNDAPSTPPPTTPGESAIRLAATVVILRPGAAGREVYMVRRSAKSPFMPSTLVFPGGRLDPEDGPPEDDASWEHAARREVHEEVGLRLDGRAMRWFDTWLTPSGESRRRYLARFYVVELGDGEGHEAEADGVETHEGRWATAQEHLQAWEAEEVDLPPPTVCVLLGLRTAESDGLSTLLDIDPREPILPKIGASAPPVTILLPHHPDYADTPGDHAAAPSRAHSLPTHFERDGRRWRPG